LVNDELVAQREDFDLQRQSGAEDEGEALSTAITTACMAGTVSRLPDVLKAV
jgi:hypothetical protein